MNNFFDQIPFFAISKMAIKTTFELGKLPKIQFQEKHFLIYFISQVFFFAWTFLDFLARCVDIANQNVQSRIRHYAEETQVRYLFGIRGMIIMLHR